MTLRRAVLTISTAALAVCASCSDSAPRPAHEPEPPRPRGAPSLDGSSFDGPSSSERGFDETEQRHIDQLLALGYLQASSEDASAAPSGVTVHSEREAWPGFNLINSGHAAEASLVDMDGRTVHRWQLAFEWPDGDAEWFRGRRYWRRVHLLPDGGLLAIYDYLGIVKVDKDSKLVWSWSGNAHHDLFVNDEGEIVLLAERLQINPLVSDTEKIKEDYIVVLGPDGVERRRISIVEALARSEWKPWLDRLGKGGDILHTNTVAPLSGRLEASNPAFKAGRLLVSLTTINAIAVVDFEEERVVWALKGSFRFQHDPHELENGRILLFDNVGTPDRSAVVELDPKDGAERWRYQQDVPNAFFTFCCGGAQRLPNGNTLITETGRGRAFEIAPDERVVWEYWNPAVVEDDDDPGTEKVASLFEVQRVPTEEIHAWLPASMGSD